MNERLKKLFEKDKRTSNLILVVILLVLVLISSNYIFNDESKENELYKQTLSENVKENVTIGVEEKLANIISKIDGIKNVDVMITYSNTEKIIPVYDTKEDINTTTDGTKKITEKTVAYESEGSSKIAMVESKEAAIAIGAIVVAEGTVTEGIKNEIKAAVSMVTDVPLHKVQLFINK